MTKLIFHWAMQARQRTLYTLLSIAIASFTFIVLMALSAPFTLSAVHDAHSAHTANAARGLGPGALPLAYVARIAAVPGVQAVSYGGGFPAACGSSDYLAINVVGGKGYGTNGGFMDAASKATAAAWRQDKQGLLVGDVAANKCSWHVGQTVTVKSMMSPSDAGQQFRIDGIYHSNKQAVINQLAYAHYAYVNAARKAPMKDTVAWISENISQDADIDEVTDRIDQLFAHSYPSTHTVSNAKAQSMLAQFGDIRSVVVWILAAVFFCMLLVTANVMSHAAAERRAALAVMNAMGFRRLRLARLFAGESCLLIGAGAAVGIVLGVFATDWIQPRLPALMAQFGASWIDVGIAVAIAVAGAALTAVAPLVQVARLKAAEHLRA